jgi:hypothetical protein
MKALPTQKSYQMAGAAAGALAWPHDRLVAMSDARKRALDLLGRTLDWKDEVSAEVLQRSEKTGSPLSKILVERGVDGDEALAVACLITQIPPVPVDWVESARKLDLSDFDPVVLWQMQMVPFSQEGGVLRVAFWSADDARNQALFAGRTWRAYLTLEREITLALLALIGPPPQPDTLSLSKDQMKVLDDFSPMESKTILSNVGSSSFSNEVWATDPGLALAKLVRARESHADDKSANPHPVETKSTVIRPNQIGEAQGGESMTNPGEYAVFADGQRFEQVSLEERPTLLNPALASTRIAERKKKNEDT